MSFGALCRRRSVASAGAALLLALASLLPRAATARDDRRDAFSGAVSSLPLAERALTGGIAVLRAPGARMIRIPRSRFRMGSVLGEMLEAAAECAHEPLGFRCDESTFADETPAHMVVISSFWLDRTEVTVSAYQRCVELGRCRAVPFAEGGKRFDHPEYPVSLVRFDDAADYCRFRGARLPTEAEFERAMRGASQRRYPWGRLYNSHAANHGRLGWDASDASDGFAELAPVGSFPAGKTREGFLDLAGNVAEWVQDRYSSRYAPGEALNPQGPSAPPASSERVVRGGSYAHAGPWLRAAARRFNEPNTRRPTLGFRCAQSSGR